MQAIFKFTDSKIEIFFKKYNYLFLFTIISSIIFLRFRLLEIPLERDEGEYAYMGQLILDGIPPYKFASNMKLPGTYYMYAFFLKIFGQTIRGIHIAFLSISILNISILHSLIKKNLSYSIAFFASFGFGIYTTSPYLLGFAFHATHLVLFYFLIASYIFFKAIEIDSNKYFLVSGLFLGMSFLMKQQAIFLVLFLGFYLLVQSILKKAEYTKIFKQSISLIMGTILPFLFVCLYLFYKGVFSEFWFWTFSYASKYISITSISEGIANLKNTVLIISHGYKFFWFSSILGLFILILSDIQKEKKLFFIFFAFFSFLTTIPGLYFREHYFIPFIPSILIFSGISFSGILILLENKISFKILLSLYFLICLFLFRNSINTFKSYYFSDSPNKISRFVYGANPFNEALIFSKFIKENSNPEDKIFVFGSEPEIYFYSNRKSASPFIYMYPLMEEHSYASKMQTDLVNENLPDSAKFFVIVNPKLNYSWGITKKTDMKLVNYIDKIRKDSKYKQVAICEIISIDKTDCKFKEESSKYIPVGDYYIELFQKN